MNDIYRQIESKFEKLTLIATRVLGNSITFLLALILVGSWWANSLFENSDPHIIIGDFIIGTTFLCLFIIQKSSNRYSALINLKINELIASHERADNSVMDDTAKTEEDMIEQSKEYLDRETKIDADVETTENADGKAQND